MATETTIADTTRAVYPTRRGVSLAVSTRKYNRILSPGMQILSAEAAAELAALEARRDAPEHRAKVRLKELPRG